MVYLLINGRFGGKAIVIRTGTHKNTYIHKHKHTHTHTQTQTHIHAHTLTHT